MKDLEEKIKGLEKQKREAEERQAQEEEAERLKQQQRLQGNRGFLDNIKSYSVEDI